MLQSMPIAHKLALMLLVVVQASWHKPHVEPVTVASLYAAALCVLLACLLPAAVFSVLDREQTATFLLQTAGQMLATAGGMHALLLQRDTGHATVFLQTMLAHIFYCVASTAHQHKHRHTLLHRRGVHLVCLGAMVAFPLALSMRCAAHAVDLSVALMAMFAADVMHLAVALGTLVLVAAARLYQRCWLPE